MKYGLSDQEYQYLDKQLITPLKTLGAKIYIFGSRARATHKKFSDIDILVVSPNDLSRVISQLSDTLEEGNFPYKVDIVEERLLATSYLSSVLTDRVEV